MSEPKGPPTSGAAPVKKSSKKSSSRAHASQPLADVPLTTSAPPVGAVPNVPRIPLAEPKPDVVGAESKRKPAKKRTSTTSRGEGNGTQRESTPPGPAGPAPPGPDPSTTVDAVAAAKQKEDAEREKQARREAKRLRAKEAEEAKRKEELAKQAEEEARRLEEQRQREARQKQQTEALNANAEEVTDEYEDDGFENYEDEFEQEEESQPKSTPLPVVGSKASKKRSDSSNPAADEAELKRIQLAMQAETKGLQAASRPPSSGSSQGSKPSSRGEDRSESVRPQTSIASSIAGLKQSLDPRAKRTKEILERRKFEVEKFTLFQQNPVSEQDKVLHRLRRGLVKQAFVQTSDGARSLGTQTKAPSTHDKAMHFPDDIGVDVESASPSVTGDNNADESFASSSSSRFFKFLEHAAYVCETLAVENVMASEAEAQGNQQEKHDEDAQKSEVKRRYPLLPSSRLDKKLVFPSTKAEPLRSLERLLQGRELVALRFSPAVSSTLISCYGAARESKEQEALFRDKTISCVWDVNLPYRPQYLLKNEGVASSVCLSPSRELFVIVGTADGTIHVWDLRPQSMIQSAVTVDGLAVSTPVYSTCGMDYKAAEQHASTIVSLEPIGRNKSGGGTFQFGSMDDRGVLIIWSLIEFEAGDEALITDKCVEIGGSIKMVMNIRIDVQQQYLAASVAAKPLRRRGSKASVTPLSPTPVATTQIGPIAAVVKCFPHDPNQFVIGTRTGLLLRGHRFEKASSRMQYQREQGMKTIDASAGVVGIDFHPFEPEYFLVGYEDGTICLYHTSVFLCLTSWDESPFGVSVCAVAWSPSRPAVFYASFSNGNVLVWDLLECTNGPTLSYDVDALKDVSPVELASSLYPLVLSSEKMRTSRPAIAWRTDPGVSPFQFAIHELGPEFTLRSTSEQETVAKVLSFIL